MKNHLKRLAAPKHWTIARKQNKYIARPRPGRPFALAMPLSHVMKTLLHVADTTKQVRDILFHSGVLLNGKRVYDHRRPVGFMDVISFPAAKQHFTITLSHNGKLVTIKADPASRLVKVKNKSRHAGKIQVNCTDGSNFLLDKCPYNTGDTLIVSGKDIKKQLPLQAGMTAILTGGSSIATIGKISSVEGDVVILETENGAISTHKRHAFVVGKDKPEVQLR